MGSPFFVKKQFEGNSGNVTATPKIIEQAQDELLWWQAANLEFPGEFRDQEKSARERVRTLQRAARLAHLPSRLLPQEAIDQVMDLLTMPDIIPDLLRDFCEITLEWRPGGKEGFSSCPFCGKPGEHWSINFATGLHHCFVCGEGGSLKWLLMRKSGLGFRKLFERLAAYCGVSIEPLPAAKGGILL